MRTATLAYDAVALVKTQANPQQRFSQQGLTNPSGFTGIDGLFRFRLYERRLPGLLARIAGAMRIADGSGKVPPDLGYISVMSITIVAS